MQQFTSYVTARYDEGSLSQDEGVNYTQVVIHCIWYTVHNIRCSFHFIAQLASLWSEDSIDVQKAKGFVHTFCPEVDNKRYTVEQVADFITAPDYESELADIDIREIENEVDSDDGDPEEPDHLTVDGLSELILNEFLTVSDQ